MNTNNIVYAKMICPLCQQNVETEIKVDIGDTRQIHQYTIGDRIIWRRNVLVQNGGRPGNGNIDVDGFSYSPVCGDRASVSVIIRNDMIKDVVINPGNDANEHPSSYVHQPAQAMQVPQIPNLPNRGHVTINFDPEWLTDRRQKKITLLAELGVIIYAPFPGAKFEDCRIMLPHGLHPVQYIEIAYLLTQLIDENDRQPPVEYVESYPHGVKFRIKKPDET